jgi:hypothetical protein
VPIEAEGFPGWVKREQDLAIDDNMLAHALFTTGRAKGDELGHGGSSVAEFLHKWATVAAYFDFAPSTGQLSRSALAQSLDRSEKAPLSYVTAQAMTQIVAEKLLRVRRLIHFDRASIDRHVTFCGGERPDLIGWSVRGQVLLAEAKGRARRYDGELLEKCSRQLNSVGEIDGGPPELRLASVSWLQQQRVHHYVELSGEVDQPDPESGSSPVSVESEALTIRSYYAPFLAAFDRGEATFNIRDHTGAAFRDLGVEIYLPTTVVELVRGFEPMATSVQTIDRAIAEAAGATDERAHLDGSIFRTDISQLRTQTDDS